MHAVLSGLKGVHAIADDILIAGSGDTIAEAQRDHDANLLALLERCRQKNIKLNRAKLCLNRETTRYMGYLLTSSGLRPDPRKVEAILQMYMQAVISTGTSDTLRLSTELRPCLQAHQFWHITRPTEKLCASAIVPSSGLEALLCKKEKSLSTHQEPSAKRK